MSKKKYRFEMVAASESGVAFPLDMLRYDQCWPGSESDANTIGRSIDQSVHDVPPGTQITLHALHERGWRPTLRRWNSFGWVISVLQAEPQP